MGRPRSKVPGFTQARTVLPTTATTSGVRLPPTLPTAGAGADASRANGPSGRPDRAKPLAEGAVTVAGHDVGGARRAVADEEVASTVAGEVAPAGDGRV